MSEWVLLAAGMLVRGQIDDKPSPVPPVKGVVRQTEPAFTPQSPINASVELPTLNLPEFSASDRARWSSHSSHSSPRIAHHTEQSWDAERSQPANFSIRIAEILAGLAPLPTPDTAQFPQSVSTSAQHSAIATPARASTLAWNRPDPLLPQPAALSTPRPRSGSQLYQQRIAALRSGRTYTRLSADSFHSDWVNATEQPTYEQWVSLLRSESQAIARGRGSNRLSVLVGDSISQWYPSEWLPSDRFWLNQGISGDTTAGVLQRLNAFAHVQPDTIHLMVGINDLRRGASDDEILGNIRRIIHQLRQTHPQAQILVYSILPTRLPALATSRIYGINAALRAIAAQQQATYRDLQAYFTDPSGILRAELTTDGLHLSRQGYAVWQWAMLRLT